MSATSASSKVKADIAKNRLTFEISGRLTKKQLDTLYTDVRFCVADLKPGFHVISDLSRCTLGSLNCLPTFRKIMTFLIEKRVGEVIRVVKRKSLIHKQILNFSARRQGYKPIYVSTMEEAEEFLANSTNEDAIRIGFKNLIANYTFGDSEGKGTIFELSTDCCVIDNGSLVPSVDDELTMNFILHSKADVTERFEVQTVVKQVGDDKFHCELKDLAEETRKLLWKCLVFESQREL